MPTALSHRCENILRTDNWPYAKRCDRTVTRLVRVIVGKTEGTWDPIMEQHYLCQPCINDLQIAGEEV